mmetsp:Transcript_29549/g.95386  ORF Transcript_29549/g.95386 Transcript_29549/m.95386 type:complete len:123 (+) Transcript_29549:224-592(+)
MQHAARHPARRHRARHTMEMLQNASFSAFIRHSWFRTSQLLPPPRPSSFTFPRTPLSPLSPLPPAARLPSFAPPAREALRSSTSLREAGHHNTFMTKKETLSGRSASEIVGDAAAMPTSQLS